MRYLLRHPVLSGIVLEMLLSLSEIYFSMPSHRWPAFILTAGYLHLPAATVLSGVNGPLNLHLRPVPFFWLCGALTVPLWIALLFLLRAYLDLGDRLDPRKQDAEEAALSGDLSRWRGT